MLPSTGPWAPWRLQEINWLTTNCHMYRWLFQQILCEIQANEAQDLSLRRSPSNGLKENNFRTSVVKKKKKKNIGNKQGRNAICSLVLPKMENNVAQTY